MNNVARLFSTTLICASAVSATVLNAAQFTLGSTVTVTENSVSPAETITVGNTDLGNGTYAAYSVLAGVNNLTVSGVSVQGFCIDPFHFSFSGPATGYTVETLQTAPKPPGGGGSGMGAIKADAISKLWAMDFHAGMTPAQAAALQVAIWQIVGTDGGIGGTQIVGNPIDGFTISGNAQAIADATTLLNGLANYTGPGVDLVALSHSVNGQDYVIANVPDGATTLGLLGMGLLALAATGRKLRTV